MRYQFYWDTNKANIGCGALLVLLGLVLISPVVAWLVKLVGWILIVVGILVVALGVMYLVFNSRRREP